jgi:hypothetical protein
VNVNRRAIIRRIKATARSRALVFTDHALNAMIEDNESKESVSDAIAQATSFSHQTDGTWRVHGDGLTAIVDARIYVVVVTIFV